MQQSEPYFASNKQHEITPPTLFLMPSLVHDAMFCLEVFCPAMCGLHQSQAVGREGNGNEGAQTAHPVCALRGVGQWLLLKGGVCCC
jgi:hypothetical protein